MRAVSWAHGVGLPLQINTTVCADTVPFLEQMAAFVETLGIVFWEVFFLVPTGRGTDLGGLRPEECERVFALLHRVQQKSSFIVKVTEAPHYRRHVAQRVRQATGAGGHPAGTVEMPSVLTTSEGPGHTVGLAPRGVNAGNGFLFVSHRGEVFPSGFLPVAAGSVREKPLADIYRNAPLLRALREPDLLKGRCGYCEFRQICGGSRSRAFAMTGDPFGTDPWCAYQPAKPAPAQSASWPWHATT
jgi:radical SAM protein with 4Fe4S-binding SPASM domain